MGIDTFDQYWLDGRKSPTSHKIVRVQLRKRSRGILNPALVSLALVTSLIIISNQSFMTIMSNHLTNTHHGLTSKNYNERSLISLVSASPAPEPSPASGRTATSGSHRVPPMNGSIFGKRSVSDGLKTISRSDQTSSDSNINQKRANDAPRSDFQQQQQQQSRRLLNPSDSLLSTKDNYQTRDQRPTMRQDPQSEANNYNDIITNIIEEFLALNNQSDPEEASVSFCRMIVYECSQMLSSRNKPVPRLRRKKVHAS